MDNQLLLKDGTPMPQLGMGTWNMGENPKTRFEEIRALRHGIQEGMTLLDTAEMYGEGLSEELISEVLKGLRREDLFLVSKFYPHHGKKEALKRSCKNSLKRLGTAYLDLYLLHWRGSVPLAETVEGLEELKAEGLIRNWGVSNFDVEDLEELLQVPQGENCRVNQVLYHLGSRGIERDLLPYAQAQGILTMAYCPMAHDAASRKRITGSPLVKEMARRLEKTPEQLMLAFLLAQKNLCVIPKASTLEHVNQNAQMLSFTLSMEDLAALSAAFPPPSQRVPLDML